MVPLLSQPYLFALPRCHNHPGKVARHLLPEQKCHRIGSCNRQFSPVLLLVQSLRRDQRKRHRQFFSSVLPNSNQCQDYPLNRVEVPSRSFNLMLYAVLPEVAVKIPVHAFNSLMLLGYLTKPLCTASQA